VQDVKLSAEYFIGSRRNFHELSITSGIAVEFNVSFVMQKLQEPNPDLAFKKVKNKVKLACVSSAGALPVFLANVKKYSGPQSILKSSNILNYESNELPYSKYDTHVLHTPPPTSIPTSFPSCGVGSEIGPNGLHHGCLGCTPGYFANVYNSSDCTPCPMKTFTNEYNQSVCKPCPYPRSTYHPGSSECRSFDVALVDEYTANNILYPIFYGVFFLAVLFANNNRIALALVIYLPAQDTVTNLVYIMSENFGKYLKNLHIKYMFSKYTLE